MATALQDKEIFQQENDQLLKDLLDMRFFSVWRERDKQLMRPDFDQLQSDRSLWDSTMLELYLTAACNQKCEYCYLQTYQDKLYPKEAGCYDFKRILKNTRILLDWCREQEFHIGNLDVFTGEILHTQFGLDVIDLIIDEIKNGLKIDCIMWASNMSFLLNEEQTWRIQSRIDTLRELTSPLILSASVDGYVIEERSRPLNSKKIKPESFYEDLFIFCKRNNYKFHPMVAACNIHWWKENFDWWVRKLDEYDFGTFLQNVMALEVRNNDWTEEAIQDYNNFMDYMIEYQLQLYNGDIKKLAYCIVADSRGFDKRDFSTYVPWAMVHSMDFTSCTLSHTLTVRPGDLVIAPCHRTAYPQLLYGKFIVENDKIVDIKAINPSMAIKTLMVNYKSGTHGCDSCPYNDYCLRGCLGSQMENMGDPWYPIPGVCNFQRRKYAHLLYKFNQLGIIDILRQITPYSHSYNTAKNLVDLHDWVVKNDVGKYT